MKVWNECVLIDWRETIYRRTGRRGRDSVTETCGGTVPLPDHTPHRAPGPSVTSPEGSGSEAAESLLHLSP